MSHAFAWDTHKSQSPWILEGLSPEAKRKVAERLSAPKSAEQEKAIHRKLVEEFVFNPSAKISSVKGLKSPSDILLGEAVDEPDQGMDDGLDVSADQKFMGGTKGPTSRGFRHMYFGGWKPAHPVSTFQVPSHAIGEAPARAEKLALRAKEMIRSTEPGVALWGWRVLGWAIHYIEDLAQPFHSAQIPNMRMVPWASLFKWPPSKGFDSLVQETTRTIANYHWSFEKYAARVQAGCPTIRSASPDKTLGKTPAEIVASVVERSIRIAPVMGAAELKFFGTGLKKEGVDLPGGRDILDYDKLATDPKLAKERERMEKVICEAMGNSVQAGRDLIHWALNP